MIAYPGTEKGVKYIVLFALRYRPFALPCPHKKNLVGQGQSGVTIRAGNKILYQGLQSAFCITHHGLVQIIGGSITFGVGQGGYILRYRQHLGGGQGAVHGEHHIRHGQLFAGFSHKGADLPMQIAELVHKGRIFICKVQANNLFLIQRKKLARVVLAVLVKVLKDA